ncbi:hypothetical protein L7F22_028998 [Adiantum nelumboides]|nr:hypothetical protein [Adiantum nelumboides]
MDAFLSPFPFANTNLPSLNEGYGNMPCFLLLKEQGLHLPFTPSSPSLDMEAALQHLSSSWNSESSSSPRYERDASTSPSSSLLGMEAAIQDPSSSCDSELSSNPISFDDADVLMVDPFLDYLNEVLMEEQAEEDVLSMRQDVKASYNAIVSSLYDIIGECTSCDSLEEEKTEILCSKQEMVQNSPHRFSETAYVTECSIAGGSSNLRFNNSEMVQKQELTTEFDFSFLNDKSNAELSSVKMSFEEFKVKAGYADLYVGKPSLSDASTKMTRNEGKKKSSRAAWKGRKSVTNASAEVGGFVDLRELLVSCAQAAAIGDVKKASEILQELYQVHGVSDKGNGLQRTAHFFCDALVARLGGMGGHQYRLMCENASSVVSFLRASKMWYGMTPYMKIMHYFANQNILKAAEGASRLHILDYGFFYGMQWPCLINALADRKGGAPLLVITGIECSKPGQNTLEWLHESGQRLAAYARTCNVPFQFHAIVSDRWEDIDHTSLHLQESEIFVINCMKRLHLHADESVDPTLNTPPRQKLLMSMRNLNPHLLLIAEINSASNSSFFVSRFREALYYYCNIMDMLNVVWGDTVDRLYAESVYYARDILNVVACEGAERVERPETYRQWDLRIKRAGFELLPVPSVVLSRSKSYVKKHYHNDFIVSDDAYGWMLMGWKGRILLSVSAWKPCLNN